MKNARIPFVFAAAVSLGCTTTGLHRDPPLPPDPPAMETVTLQGSFCTEDPETVAFPVKVWFIIDDSGSMGGNDPNMVRYTAAKQLAVELEDEDQANPSMFFGGQIFSGDTGVRFSLPDRFTPSAAVFGANVDVVTNAGGGGTPYVAALSVGVAELSADITENPTLARRTRYVVIFLSDGAPSDDNGPEFPGIRAGIEALLALRERAGDVTLNTVFLGGDGAEEEMLLEAMATAGGGIFKSFPSGDTLDYSDFDFSAIRRNYNQRFFLASNLHAMPAKTGHQIDSDADGLADYQELELGTDVGKRDTDADGCGDLMEVRDAGWNPLIPGTENNECSCSPPQRTADTDLDGLTDCEEKWLATSAEIADGDKNEDDRAIGDLVPDGLDHTYLNDVNFPNDGMDFDADGVLDLAELRTHMDPHTSDGAARDHWAYRYVYLDQQAANPQCFDFKVENVSISATAASEKHAAGENEVLLYFAQSPQDNAQKEKSFRIARRIVTVGGPNVIEFVPDDFSETLVVLEEEPAP